MNNGPIKTGTLPVTIQAGKILRVYPDRMSCDVQVELGARNLYRDCLLHAGYFNFSYGSGIFGMPEEGAFVWVARSSEGSDRLFVIGYRGPSDQSGSFGGRLRTMSPGDIMMVSKNNNGVRVYREGSVEIRGVSPLCFISLEAHRQTIRTHANNYFIQSPGAEIAVTTQMPEEDADYVESCQLRTKVRAFADEKYAAVEAHIGGALTELYDDNSDNEPISVEDPVFRLLVREDNNESIVKSQLVMDRTGRIGIEPQDVRVVLNDSTGDVIIYEQDEAAAEKFILGDTFISDLNDAMTQIQAALQSLGVSLPALNTLVVNLASSVSANAPYLTPRLKVE